MFKNKRLTITIILLLLLAGIMSVVFVATQPKQAVWNGLRPGTALPSGQLEKLGAQEATISGNRPGLYEFLSDIPSAPNTIALQENTGRIELISIEEPLENPPKFASFVREFGRAELIMYPIEGELDEKIFVYPERGLAFFVHVPSDTVFRRWYFTRTNAKDFVLFSKDTLSLEPPAGERFQPPTQL